MEIIKKNKCKSVSIVGLAKNAGKTVAFNTIIKEAQKDDIRLGLASFGRDGEDVDLITNRDKPRIFIPPRAIFVTADKALVDLPFSFSKIASTGLETVLGEIGIYQAEGKGGNVELVGINHLWGIKKILGFLQDKIDLLLLDGALDRKSLAVPVLADGIILATGAILGNQPELVLYRTLHELHKLSLPEVENPLLQSKAKGILEHQKVGIVFQDGSVVKLPGDTTFTAFKGFKPKDNTSVESLVMSGALVDSFLKEYLTIFSKKAIGGSSIILRDGTKNFLSTAGYSLLRDYDISVKVLKKINILALTVNPTNPEGRDLDSDLLLKILREHIKGIPVVNVMGHEYCTEGDKIV